MTASTRARAGSSASALRGKSIALVGAGNMGQALLAGLLRHGVPAARLRIVEAKPETAAAIRRRHHVAAASLEAVGRTSDVIVLAVKPQDLPPVLRALRALFNERRSRPLVISIAAGLRLAALRRSLGRGPVVRVMPNLPAKIGVGISALAVDRGVTPAHRAVARAIMGCVGDVVELPESLFDAVTAVSGSGPAYVFLFLLALRDAGAALGLPVDVAERLAIRTALGSVRLVESAQRPLEELIAQVASKRGTTEAALNVFRRRGWDRTVCEAVAAAAARSKALSELLSSA